jgi:stage II sporulation protein D
MSECFFRKIVELEASSMLKVKPIIIIISLLIFVIICVPALVVLPFDSKEVGQLLDEHSENQPAQTPETEDDIEVAVYRSQKGLVENLPLEEYLVGVVAAEMPADFEIEALKAQALTARTYIVNQLLHPTEDVPNGAIVTDTQMHQVYKNKDELKKIWGDDYDWKIEKITQAVEETKGQIITYNGQPIAAAFFSTSNGYTENSEDYWENEYPYLKSVESPWDETSPKFIDKKTIPVDQFEKLLGVTLPTDGSVGKVIERTEGNRVGKIVINGKEFTGREVREKLNLKSSDFTWVRKGDQMVITTKGYGHGVGMSQYGANGMAKEGKTYEEIVKHFYKGVEITSTDSYETKMTAKK